MKNYPVILLSIILILSATDVYTQKKIPDQKNSGFEKGIVLTLGAGATMNESSYIFAPNMTWDLHEHFNISTGVDIYFQTKYVNMLSTINIIPHYVIRPLDKTMFQIGIGGISYKSSFLPVFSAKFDYEAYPKHYLGIQFKSYITNIVEGPAHMLLLLNYSIKF